MRVRQYMRVLAAAVVSPLLALPACSSAPPAPRERVVLAPCDITLRDVPRVSRRTPIGATITFPFRVSNPNDVPVLLERMNLNASINNSALGSNVCVPRATVRAGGTVEVPVNYDVSFISAGMGLIDALGSQSAAITVVGDAKISCADRRFDADPLQHPFQIK